MPNLTEIVARVAIVVKGTQVSLLAQDWPQKSKMVWKKNIYEEDDSSALLDLACQHSWQQGKNNIGMVFLMIAARQYSM